MIININPSGSLTVADPVAGQVDASTNKQQDHVAQALGRLLEFWKHKPNMRGLLSDYQAEINVLENAIFQVILQRFPDHAGTAQLDVLGRIVGEDRDGLSNADYLVRIRARIRANSSFGTGKDVISVLRLITSARFRFTRLSVASFRIDFVEAVTDSVMRQAASLVADTRVAGVGSSVYFVTSTTLGSRYGYNADPTFNKHIGYASVLTTSPKYGHYAA